MPPHDPARPPPAHPARTPLQNQPPAPTPPDNMHAYDMHAYDVPWVASAVRPKRRRPRAAGDGPARPSPGRPGQGPGLGRAARRRADRRPVLTLCLPGQRRVTKNAGFLRLPGRPATDYVSVSLPVAGSRWRRKRPPGGVAERWSPARLDDGPHHARCGFVFFCGGYVGGFRRQSSMGGVIWLRNVGWSGLF